MNKHYKPKWCYTNLFSGCKLATMKLMRFGTLSAFSAGKALVSALALVSPAGKKRMVGTERAVRCQGRSTTPASTMANVTNSGEADDMRCCAECRT